MSTQQVINVLIHSGRFESDESTVMAAILAEVIQTHGDLRTVFEQYGITGESYEDDPTVLDTIIQKLSELKTARKARVKVKVKPKLHAAGAPAAPAVQAPTSQVATPKRPARFDINIRDGHVVGSGTAFQTGNIVNYF